MLSYDISSFCVPGKSDHEISRTVSKKSERFAYESKKYLKKKEKKLTVNQTQTLEDSDFFELEKSQELKSLSKKTTRIMPMAGSVELIMFKTFFSQNFSVSLGKIGGLSTGFSQDIIFFIVADALLHFEFRRKTTSVARQCFGCD